MAFRLNSQFMPLIFIEHGIHRQPHRQTDRGRSSRMEEDYD